MARWTWRVGRKKALARKTKRAFQRRRFSVQDVATAFDVNVWVVQRLVKNGRVPGEKRGRKYWLDNASVNAMLAAGHHLKL